MRLGVVAALGRELDPTLRALGVSAPQEGVDSPGQSPLSVHSAAPFLFTAGGIGIRRAESAARRLAEAVQGLLSVGFCGGLEDSLSPGDVVLGGTRSMEASPSLLDLARRAGPHRIGTVETVDHVVVNREEKRTIARTTGAVAVDMEAEAVAGVAKNQGLPFLCVKVVLDTPSQPLASTYAGCLPVGLQIATRPWIIGRMMADGKRSKMAAGKLRDFFVAFRRHLGT